MKKVDRAHSGMDKSVIQKIIGSFFDSGETQKRVVIDIIEDNNSKMLFVAINDSNSKSPSSDIEIYNIQTEELLLIKRISLKEILSVIEIKLKVQNVTKAFYEQKLEMLKLDFTNDNELMILFSNGTFIFLKLTFAD